MSRFIIFVLLLIEVGWCLNVIELSNSNFDEHINGSDRKYIIQFYAPWCSVCKTFEPVYNKVAILLTGRVEAITIDGWSDTELGYRFGVETFPTIKILEKGQIWTYTSTDLSEKAIVDFALNPTGKAASLPQPIKKTDNLKYLNYIDEAIEANRTWLVIFHDPNCPVCQRLIPIFEELANLYEKIDNIGVGAYDASRDASVSKRFELDALPMVALFRQGHIYRFTGNYNLISIKSFVEKDYINGDFESGPIPPTIGWFYGPRETLDTLFRDLRAMVGQRQLILSVLFLLGVTFGLLALPLTVPKKPEMVKPVKRVHTQNLIIQNMS